MNMEEIFSFIGKVIAIGGGAAALAYAIFLFLGQKWIESKFDKNLESFKHAQEREMERFRHDVNVLFSRVTKIHEKEIEILPELWQKLQYALGQVAKITSPLQFSPNFMSMTDGEFKDFLETSRLNDTHKEALKASSEKGLFYTKTIFWYDLREAKIAVNDFHNFMINNRIFLSKDLKQEFMEIDKLLSSAISKREIGEQARDWKRISEAYEGLGEEANIVVARIEELVQERLEFSRAKPIENSKTS
jgi:hypothetical protein